MVLSAWVESKRVLIGNRELMLNHGVDIPSKDYEERYAKDLSLIHISAGHLPGRSHQVFSAKSASHRPKVIGGKLRQPMGAGKGVSPFYRFSKLLA